MLLALLEALQETVWMVFVSTTTALILALPLGSLLFVTQTGNLWPKRWLNQPLSFLLSLSHSVPYVMIVLAVIPIIRPIWGQHAFMMTCIVPLTLAAIPAFSRNVQAALNSVPSGLVETALAFGASPQQIFKKILWPEALPSLITSQTESIIHLVGYSTIAGALTGGGLSGLAIHKGYYALEPFYIFASLSLLLAFIQSIKLASLYLLQGQIKFTWLKMA